MPFSQQQTPFAVVDFETDVESRERLRAGEILAARGAFAMVWIDHALIVRRRFGILADFIKLDASLAESIPAIIGLEADIRELHAAPDSILRIPNVSMISTAGAGPRLNLAFYAVDQYYVLVISHASGGSNLEIELSRQIRARLMAEAQLRRNRKSCCSPTPSCASPTPSSSSSPPSWRTTSSHRCAPCAT